MQDVKEMDHVSLCLQSALIVQPTIQNERNSLPDHPQKNNLDTKKGLQVRNGTGCHVTQIEETEKL
jgi:hypothetical protein